MATVSTLPSDVNTSDKLKFDRIVYSPEAEVSEEEDTEQSFMDGWQLDVEAFVYDEILVNWPAKILCKEDCKGICPVCGQNRNLKECGCDTFVPDPRMAAIQDIFNAYDLLLIVRTASLANSVRHHQCTTFAALYQCRSAHFPVCSSLISSTFGRFILRTN